MNINFGANFIPPLNLTAGHGTVRDNLVRTFNELKEKGIQQKPNISTKFEFYLSDHSKATKGWSIKLIKEDVDKIKAEFNKFSKESKDWAKKHLTNDKPFSKASKLENIPKKWLAALKLYKRINNKDIFSLEVSDKRSKTKKFKLYSYFSDYDLRRPQSLFNKIAIIIKHQYFL